MHTHYKIFSEKSYLYTFLSFENTLINHLFGISLSSIEKKYGKMNVFFVENVI